MTSSPGSVFILSAPSGTGKSTLLQSLMAKISGLVFSISTTTRPPRPGELNGRDYFFVDGATFDRMVAEEAFLEWVEVFSNRYGTSREWLERTLATGVDVLFDIEIMGAMRLREVLPSSRLIFILPPSAQEVERRLRARGTNSEEQIQSRLARAREEIQYLDHYDFVVVNDQLETAVEEIASIIRTDRSRRERRLPSLHSILDSFQLETL